MALANVRAMIDSEIEGRMRQYAWRKTPSQVTSLGIWFDLSMSPGMPVPKYWFDAPPAIAKVISQSTDGGVYHGANVSPQTKYIRQLTTRASVVTALPMTMILCDYLMYYPSIDDSVIEAQLLDNTTTIPRYTDGAGVQVIAVTVAGRTGGQSFTFNYTNSEGATGRISQVMVQNAFSAIGTIAISDRATLDSYGPFCGLQDGDSGVRSIESVTMNGADVGLFTLILVKPLAQTAIKEITAPYEKDFFLAAGNLPEVKDDAYLSFLCVPNGSLSATVLMGDLKVIWN